MYSTRAILVMLALTACAEPGDTGPASDWSALEVLRVRYSGLEVSEGVEAVPDAWPIAVRICHDDGALCQSIGWTLDDGVFRADNGTDVYCSVTVMWAR